MHALPLRLAAGALVAGGLVLGAAPLPLADFGCRPALAAGGALDQTIEVVVACADARADRQTAVGVLLTAGVALAGASVRGRRSAASGGPRA
ncbi:hypothetical protein [Kineococcus sp. SYSU DK004]|uniref:hypothetical protein n=1 Tax=Kineococcus sp. SYSU DK004 TaxID=3383125 RepID=UPI003D7D7297